MRRIASRLFRYCARGLAQRAPTLTAYLYRGTLRLLLATCRWHATGVDGLHAAAQGPCALVLWHDRLLLAAPLLHRYAPDLAYVAAVSDGREGKLLALLAASYRQWHSLTLFRKRGAASLRTVVNALLQHERVVVLTPDGPCGPRHQLKPGIAYAAVHTGATVIPVTWRASRSWELSTWDRLALPKPFSVIEVSFGPHCVFDSNTPVEDAKATIQALMEV